MVNKHNVSSYNVNNRSLCFSTDHRVARFTNHEDENLLSSLSNRCFKKVEVYMYAILFAFFFLVPHLLGKTNFQKLSRFCLCLS